MQIKNTIVNPSGDVERATPNYYPVTLLQFSLGTCLALVLFGLSLLLWLLGFLQKLSIIENSTNPVSLFLMSASSFLCALLLIPSCIYALSKLTNNPISWVSSFLSYFHIKPINLIAVIVLVFTIGTWVSRQENLAWIFLPMFHISAIAIPILLFTQMSLAHLQTGSEQRKWGLFTSGLIISPIFIIVAEITALLLFGFIVLVYIHNRPEIFTALMGIAQQIQSQKNNLPDIRDLLNPVISQPWFIYSVLLFGAVIVPAIEEFIKPVGMWLLFNHPMTPQQGFAAGVLCGSGYALFESLSLGSSEGEWSLIVLARLGTGIIHIFTAGLLGWAISQAWRRSRYVNLVFAYLLAVSIHGLWNGLALISIIATMISPTAPSELNIFLHRINTAVPFGLVTLLIGSLIVLVISNHSLRNMVD